MIEESVKKPIEYLKKGKISNSHETIEIPKYLEWLNDEDFKSNLIT
jgi:hypothetical protein